MRRENRTLEGTERGGSSILDAPPPPPVKKRNRRKTHLGWEQADRDSNGLYTHNAESLARKFRKLTPMELRVCAMVKEMLPSWRIAERFGITEKAVENYRVHARKKMGIHSKKPLTYYLTKI